MKPKYLNNLIEESYSLFTRMKSGVRTAGLVALVGTIIGVGVYGCKKEEPVRRDTAPTESVEEAPVREDTPPIESIVQEPQKQETLPKESVSLDEKLYENTKIAFVSNRDGNYEIYIMNADGSEQKRLTNNPTFDYFPSWSPDGKKIAFTSDRDGNYEIYIMNVDGSEQKNLTNNRAHDFKPSCSPDRKKIAFVSDRDGNYESYVMNVDGSGQKRLTKNPGLDAISSWSPNGMKIAFMSDRDRNEEIYVMNANGSEQKRLTNNHVNDGFPSWSPDGKRMAFVSDRDGNDEIYIMNADGSGQDRLTYSLAGEAFPSWSPDGKRMAFALKGDGNFEIYIMNADGSGQERLTYSPAGEAFPSWSPFLSSESQQAEEPGREQEAVDDIDSRPQPVTSDTQPEEPVVQDPEAIRLGYSTSVVNGRIYVIGGKMRHEASPLSTVEEYDPATDTWTRKADMPTAERNFSTSVVNGKIYSIGYMVVQEYDPVTDKWTKKFTIKALRMRRGFSTSVVNGKIYVIGGSTSSLVSRGRQIRQGGILPTVEEYDPATNNWTRKADMPTARELLSTSVVNGKIYAIGGMINQVVHPGGPNRSREILSIPVPTVEAYDPLTDTWTKKADMPTARWNFSTSVVNGKIYSIRHSVVQEYDPVTDEWTKWTRKGDIPTGGGLSTTVVNEKIYIVKMRGDGIGGLSTVEEYDPEMDK